MTEYIYSEGECAQLKQFASAVWGDSKAVLRRSGDIEFIDLKDYPVFRHLFAGPLFHDKILVREEYRIALRELETRMYDRGAYVTGQSGIGKTHFLIYVLVVRLGQRRAVALQFPDGRAYYAVFQDSVSFHSLDDARPLAEFHSMWALTDSNYRVRTPSGIFLGFRECVRVIQTTPPTRDHWKGWSKRAGAVGYIMDIWSEKEIADLAELLELDAERMTFLARQWGCVPGNLLRFMRRNEVDSKIEAWYRRCASRAVFKCRENISSMADAQFDDDLSEIFFCQPRINKSGTIDRKQARAIVPTRTIRCLLGEALQHEIDIAKLDFFTAFRLFSDDTQAYRAAAIIFENWFHSFFSAARTIWCNWVQGSGGISSLTGTNTLIPSGWVAVKNAQPPYFWIAPKDFPGIDSALVLDTAIYVFQVTISPSTYKPPMDGMAILRNRLPIQLKEIPWRVIFVGDDDSPICAVANKWVGKIFFPTDRTSVPIAWSTVDPVVPFINYTEFREESPELESEVESNEEAPMEVVSDSE